MKYVPRAIVFGTGMQTSARQARAQLLYADNKLVVLDEDGTLGVATPSPQGLKVLARAQILENRAWTPPTLVGRTLYVRDRKTMAAYDLGS